MVLAEGIIEETDEKNRAQSLGDLFFCSPLARVNPEDPFKRLIQLGDIVQQLVDV